MDADEQISLESIEADLTRLRVEFFKQRSEIIDLKVKCHNLESRLMAISQMFEDASQH